MSGVGVMYGGMRAVDAMTWEGVAIMLALNGEIVWAPFCGVSRPSNAIGPLKRLHDCLQMDEMHKQRTCERVEILLVRKRRQTTVAR